MIRRPLVLALAFALLPAVAGAEDLMQTYELARAGDPQLSAAESTRDAIREGEVQARANLLPQINGEASFNKSETESEGGASVNPDGSISIGRSESDSSSRDFRINLRQMVYDRSNFTRLDSERALSRASDFSLEAAGDSLITRTSLAYFNVLIAIETLAAAEAQEEALKKQFDFADKRLEVGLAPITDVHEARAQYDNARANTIVTRNALEDAYQALAEITGQTIRNLKGLPDDFRPALPNEQDAEAWVATAIGNNPNLRSLEEQVVSAEADVGTARAGHWPSLYFNGNYSDQAFWGDRTNLLNNNSIPIGSENRGPNFGVVLSVPIFSGGATQSRVRQALANRDVRADELEQQKRAVIRSTRNAYQVLLAGISEVEARRLALVSANSAYEASQVGLEVGTRTVIDVLINQNTLFNARREYARAKYTFLQARLALEQSAGTLDGSDVQDVNRLLTVNAEAKLAQ